MHPATTSSAKRATDVIVASIALLVTAPVIAVAALLIRATSPGPIVFRQPRVGLDGEHFEMLKLRSMTVDGDDGPHRDYSIHKLVDPDAAPTANGTFKLDDPRVTSIGRLLRRTSIDELPQLVNVLRGEMSLVGPRPMLDWEFEHVRGVHRERVATRPGITGLWQVEGRSRLSTLEMLDLDVTYIDTWRPGLDLRILARTPCALLSR